MVQKSTIHDSITGICCRKALSVNAATTVPQVSSANASTSINVDTANMSTLTIYNGGGRKSHSRDILMSYASTT